MEDAVKDEIYAAISGELGRRELPEVGTVVDGIFTVIICPVCGNKALDNYDICRFCGWEHDVLPEDQFSAANGDTLEGYRRAYNMIVRELFG